MEERASLEPAPRRARFGLFALLVTAAFVIGLALMWFAMRGEVGWWNGTAPAAQPSAVAAPAAPEPSTPELPPAASVSPNDPATLVTRENALAAQLAALEARTASIAADIAGAGDQAGRAEAILITAAARRALDRGQPLGYLEEQLRLRFGTSQPRAVAAVIAAAQDPVTLEALRHALQENAPLLLGDTADGWLNAVISELRNLVIVHEANVPSPLPAARLARARRLLDRGQVEAAMEEVSRLPGAANAQNWMAAARRYVDARKALDVLEQTAVMGTVRRAPVGLAPVVTEAPQGADAAAEAPQANVVP